MAPLVQKVKPGSRRDYGDFHAPDEKDGAVAAQMGSSWLGSLSSIGRGATQWRDPHDGGREMTWALYSDHRELLHATALMGLSGDFDTSADSPAKLAHGKATLASAARAFASFGHPGDAERLAQIDKLSPVSPPTAEEIAFCSQIGSSRLIALLDGATQKIGAEAVPLICKLHKEAANEATLAAQRHSRFGEGYLSTHEKALGHMFIALFECQQRDSSLMDEATRDAFKAHVDQMGLGSEMERRSLELAAAGSTRRRHILKA